MGLFDKIFHGYYYIVDYETLKKYLEEELKFSLENKLEASANLNIYLNGIRHHIQIWNDLSAGVTIYYDSEEYKTLEELYNSKFSELPNYFKIELIDIDNNFLNNYKKEHPELNVNDY